MDMPYFEIGHRIVAFQVSEIPKSCKHGKSSYKTEQAIGDRHDAVDMLMEVRMHIIAEQFITKTLNNCIGCNF